ncbi:MAG: helix-turn-helix transcriptional regulator [Firmicutes bacterium]|nr:helix-turn-helix transcriptional regulator [Bacillota bacterium]
MNLETQLRIADNLKALRITRDLNQAEMADAAGVGRSLYIRYELAKSVPDAEFLFNVANRFGFDMGILFEADRQVFLSHLAASQFCDDELQELMSMFRKLSPVSRGMLLERAIHLLDWDRIRQGNMKVLSDRKGTWKEGIY